MKCSHINLNRARALHRLGVEVRAMLQGAFVMFSLLKEKKNNDKSHVNDKKINYIDFSGDIHKQHKHLSGYLNTLTFHYFNTNKLP